MTEYEDEVLDSILAKIERFTKMVGTRDSYAKEELSARVVKDLPKAYLNIMQASGMRGEHE